MTEQPDEAKKTPISEGVAEGEESDLHGAAREVVEGGDDEPGEDVAPTPGGG